MEQRKEYIPVTIELNIATHKPASPVDDSTIIIPAIESFPSKRLVTVESSSKFGLINKQAIGHGAFVHRDHYCGSGIAGEKGPTIRDVMDLLDQTMSTQQIILKTILGHNQHLSNQVECLKQKVAILAYHINNNRQQIEQKTVDGQPKIEGLCSSEKMDSLNKCSLLNYLTGKTDFDYSIELAQPHDPVFVKERNFKYSFIDYRMSFKIVKKGDALSTNSPIDELYLEFKLYSAENPPKLIESNNSGTM